ncbi:microvitellogenin-like [Pectinophora gossypiella]|uniref:microvitellogenin-like n=1 Tax=Pectinophora gossypiella TaxID=13191 RepID=UPI00214E936D|nr:microvitellogenin-like [Pectinophora gossypiella]
MHSISLWNFSRSPNYETNVDLIYPYSEVPYIGTYKLVKIPLSTNKTVVPVSELIEHVDYWGEGRINAPEGSTGFTNCYNVNHQYQLVSNGEDRDKKIPNRIPVISYANCNTSSYVKDNSVKLVTLMGAPINKSCAEDIARMVNADFGKVVIYGFGANATDIKNLEAELTKKGVLFCHGYKLPELLTTVTLFDDIDHRGYLNVTDLSGELYRKVFAGDFINAVNISKTLENSGNGASISDVVTKLLKEGKRNTTQYAYKLWDSDARDMVTNYFPNAFKNILDQDYVKIINKKDSFTLRLAEELDDTKERLALGDSKDKSSEKIRWKFVAIEENKILYFKILNISSEMFLKLEDVDGSKKSKGGSSAIEKKSQWFLDPVKVDDDLLFYIINREFNQGLKLDENADSIGNKQLLGHDGAVYGQPQAFGWYITSW